MKAIDRACIIVIVWLGIVNICAVVGSKDAGIVAITTTIVSLVLIVYENRICHYEEKAEYYKNLFMKQNSEYIKTVIELGSDNNDHASSIDIEVLRKRQKSGIDKSKAS